MVNTDQIQLQQDLMKVETWCKTWDMKAHPDKCKHMSISLKKSTSNRKYYLENIELEKVHQAKYLGINITNNLNWDVHVRTITNKANSTLGLIRRTLKHASREAKEKAYFALVRPILEYADVAWNPYHQKHVDMIEMVQRSAARFVLNISKYEHITEDIKNNLKWESLESRRLNHQLNFWQKIESKELKIDLPKEITKSTHNKDRYTQLHCRVDSYKYSFFPRTLITINQKNRDKSKSVEN
jgi:hypothetical protein